MVRETLLACWEDGTLGLVPRAVESAGSERGVHTPGETLSDHYSTVQYGINDIRK
jgi:hypothetical protein